MTSYPHVDVSWQISYWTWDIQQHLWRRRLMARDDKMCSRLHLTWFWGYKFLLICVKRFHPNLSAAKSWILICDVDADYDSVQCNAQDMWNSWSWHQQSHVLVNALFCCSQHWHSNGWNNKNYAWSWRPDCAQRRYEMLAQLQICCRPCTFKLWHEIQYTRELVLCLFIATSLLILYETVPQATNQVPWDTEQPMKVPMNQIFLLPAASYRTWPAASLLVSRWMDSHILPCSSHSHFIWSVIEHGMACQIHSLFEQW